MGIHVIKMPDLGEGIAEVEVVAWRVAPGDAIKEDQVLADVMTDKATVEIPSPVHGTVMALGGKVGESLAVGAELIRLEVEGAGNAKADAKVDAKVDAAQAAQVQAAKAAAPSKEDANFEPADIPHGPVEAPHRMAGPSGAPTKSTPVSASSASSAPAAPAAPKSADKPAKPAAPAYVQGGGHAAPAARPAMRPAGDKPMAPPAVRQRAWDLGVELQYVMGSGPAGRITHADLDNYLAGASHAHAHAGGADGRYAELQGEQNVPLIGLRRKIAEKMQMAKRQIPHFTYVEEVDVTELEALRTQINARYGNERPRLTLLPLLMRALVLAIRKFPEVNARYDDQANVVTRYNPVHIGIATQTDAGLMVPVVRNAEARDPWASAQEIVRLAEAARTGKAVRDELSGSTITITSLGPLGGIVTTPVINHPEVAIVGVNRILERPVVKNGGLVPRKLMNLSSSFDHRVIDGMVAAEFIQAIRGYLENPAMLFIE